MSCFRGEPETGIRSNLKKIRRDEILDDLVST
jgi:uncharacterized protein (UPF0297 family)